MPLPLSGAPHPTSLPATPRAASPLPALGSDPGPAFWGEAELCRGWTGQGNRPTVVPQTAGRRRRTLWPEVVGTPQETGQLPWAVASPGGWSPEGKTCRPRGGGAGKRRCLALQGPSQRPLFQGHWGRNRMPCNEGTRSPASPFLGPPRPARHLHCWPPEWPSSGHPGSPPSMQRSEGADFPGDPMRPQTPPFLS